MEAGSDQTVSEWDWSDIPDVLPLISKKLEDIETFIRFRAVCKNWRSETRLSDAPRQLPWLLRSNRKDHETDLEFYSISSNKTFTISVPKASGKILAGPSHEYLLAYTYPNSQDGDSDITLLNPLTGDEIPFQSTPFHCCNLVRLGANAIRNRDIVVISVTEHIYIEFETPTNFVAFWKPNEENNPQVVAWPFEIQECAYYKGNFFVSFGDFHRHTIVIDTDTKDVTTIVLSPPWKNWKDYKVSYYMIEASDRLLRVVRFDYTGTDAVKSCFDIYELQKTDGKRYRWVKLSGIPNLILFLTKNQGLCYTISENESKRGNCIYFLKEEGKPSKNHLLCRFDVKEDKLEVIPHTGGFYGTWFVPSLM